MEYVLLVYHGKDFAEYHLPRMKNDYCEMKFGEANAESLNYASILFEANNFHWLLHHRSEYIIKIGGTEVDKHMISDGDVITIEVKKTKSKYTIVVVAVNNTIHPFKKYMLDPSIKITIGNSKENVIRYQYRGFISPQHAVIGKESDEWFVEDCKSKNGVVVGNQKINGRKNLSFGDIIYIFGLKLIVLGKYFAVDCEVDGVTVDEHILSSYTVAANSFREQGSNQESDPYYRRSPRMLGKMYTDPIEIEPPPAPQKQRKQPLILTIGPAFTMILPMLLGTTISMTSGGSGNATGLIVSGTSGAVAVLWAVVRLKNSRKATDEEEKNRRAQYETYLSKYENELKLQTEHNTNALKQLYPSPIDCCENAFKKNRLWNRNFSHEDILSVRLGLGNSPFQVPIIVPKEKFSLTNDPLSERPKKLKEKYDLLRNVPICINFAEKKLVGLVTSRKKAANIARCISLQLATNDCYSDVKMVFLYSNDEEAEWEFARWLPHTWDNERKTRFIATNKNEASDMLYGLSVAFRSRMEESEGLMAEPLFKPHYIVFVAEPAFIEGEAISKYLTNSEKDIGLSTIWICDQYDKLPNKCSDIIQHDDNFCGIYNLSMMEDERIEVKFDSISAQDADKYARELSCFKVRDAESDGEMPNSVSFLEMHGVNKPEEINIIELWRKNKPYETLRALIGKRGGGQGVYLDIHEKYHGPHGLVAGTTGSGKSETLQTYILSLALNFGPEDVGFFIIDYKGGGMANLFEKLPHTLGTITNLSGNQVHRAMVSIKGEIRRRQRIFAELDVNHIDKYMRLYRNREATAAIPHLLIIIDEFAELKKEEPELMRELISVAQVGRSLGIHLILATQKPAGVVDDNIWSNTRFRLCLRVQDRQDSNDMLKRPDAAYLTQPGRGYLQVGNDEIFELFQSGWSGAGYDDKNTVLNTNIANLITNTGHNVNGKKRTRQMNEEKKLRWFTKLVKIIRTEAFGLDGLSSTLDTVYNMLRNDGIDYQRSISNDRRMEILINEVNETLSVYGTAISNETLAARIVSNAAKQGIRLPEEKEKTQLDAVVEYISRTAIQNNISGGSKLWLPVLSNYIYLSELDNYADCSFNGEAWIGDKKDGSLSAIIGFCDDPINQSQFPVAIDFAAKGSIAVCGAVVSGKSTFMQTMIYSLCNKYCPASVNFYIIDYSSRMLSVFANAPHVGGYVTEDDTDKLNKLFIMMEKEIVRRKMIFRGGSYAQYIRANGVAEPAVIIVIDGYAGFKEKTENMYEDKLISISREGAGYGIYLAIASGGFGASEIQSRIGDNIKSVIALSMGNKFKYSDVLRTVTLDIIPEADIKGRGLINHNGAFYEFQTAVALDAPDDYTRGERIKKEINRMCDVWNGRVARTIRMIPNEAKWHEFKSDEEYKDNQEKTDFLPIGYNEKDASIYALPLKRIFTFLVTGKMRTGKSTFLKTVALSAIDKGADAYIIDTKECRNKDFAAGRVQGYYSCYDEYVSFGTLIMNELVKRNRHKNELIKDGKNKKEIAEIMAAEYKPVFIFIENLVDFVEEIYKVDISRTKISGFMENVVEKGELHNMFVFARASLEDINKIKGRRFVDLILARRTGILMGGGASQQNVFEFQNSELPFNEARKTYKAGTGLTRIPEERVNTVIIPWSEV